MTLRLFGFQAYPHEFAVTKIDVPLEECAFLLDFSRPLERIRWLGVTNKWLGLTVDLLVPVVHSGQQSGGYVVGVHRSSPYFDDLRRLWKLHKGTQRSLATPPPDELEIIADFARHFPEDCT